jgi:hypothetical protein
MSDVTAVVDTYFAMWNEDDADVRAKHIEAAWATEAAYADPLNGAHGYDELAAMVDAVHAQFPGHRFQRTSEIDQHHALVRFDWELVAPDDTVTAGGVDVGELAADGRLSRIAGFFGVPVPLRPAVV